MSRWMKFFEWIYSMRLILNNYKKKSEFYFKSEKRFVWKIGSNRLIGKEKNCFKAKFARAEIEQVF